MRKFILIVLTGIALMLAVPEFAAATPLSATGGLATAAEEMGGAQPVWHRYRYHRYHRYRWHRYRHYRVYRYRHRCWHRRYWSGRRCW
jgi:hypothetical protein